MRPSNGFLLLMIQWMCGIAEITPENSYVYGHWVEVLWYKSEHGYTPTANAADTSTLYKLSDAEINAFPTHFGTNYYALRDAETDETMLFVKTRFDYDDLSRKFGWKHYQICYVDDWEDEWWGCDWYEGYNGDRFDTEGRFGNTCQRWFTDYSGNPDCYNQSNSDGKRCFSKGNPCGDAPRKEVHMYKWQTSMTNNVLNQASAFGVDNAFKEEEKNFVYYNREASSDGEDTYLQLGSYAYYAFDILPEETTECDWLPEHHKPTVQCTFQDTIYSNYDFVPYSIYAHKNVILGGTNENSDHMWSTTCVMFADGSSYDTKDGRYCGHHQPNKWIHPNLVKGLAREGESNDPTASENEKPAAGFHIITGDDKCQINASGCFQGAGNCLVIYKGPEALIVNHQFRLTENCYENYLQVGGVRYCGTGTDDPLYAKRRFPEYLRVEDGVTLFFRYAEPLDKNNRLPDGTYQLKLCLII